MLPWNGLHSFSRNSPNCLLVGSGLSQLLTLWNAYPSRFWLLFAGVFFSVSGSSFIWPFTTIFIAEQTQSSLTLTTLMFSIEACARLALSRKN